MNALRKRQLFFLAKFFAIFVFLHALLYLFPPVFMQEAVAALEADWLGLPREGHLLFVDSQAFAITASCTGLVAGFILAAIVFALKKPGLKEKTAIAVLGLAALLLANLARVYLVLLAALAYGVRWAEAMHFFSWFVMAGLVIAIWYYGASRAYKKKSLDGFL